MPLFLFGFGMVNSNGLVTNTGGKILGRRLGIEDIGYYAEKVMVYEKILVGRDPDGMPIFKKGVQEYRVEGLAARKVQRYFEDGKTKEILSESVPVRSLYKRIKHVYDFNKVLIARRNAPNQPLFVTGKGMSKFLRLG